MSAKAVLVGKRRQTFGVHKTKAPSGRELPTKSGEGERVTMKFNLNFKLRGLLPPLSRSPFSLRLGHARGLTPHCGVIQDPRAASLPPGGRLLCAVSLRIVGQGFYPMVRGSTRVMLGPRHASVGKEERLVLFVYQNNELTITILFWIYNLHFRY